MAELKKPQELLMRILCRGGRVSYDGREYAMDIDGGLCIIFHNQDGEEHPVKTGGGLEYFSVIAEGVGFDALWLQICAENLNG